MTLNARDKKILMVLVPVAVLLALWFLLLSPKRAEVSKLDSDVAAAEQKRDSAVSNATTLEGSRSTYAKDYETVVRLGKAVPSRLDMPSLLVQLDAAAKGTGIDFKSVKAGTREPAAGAPAAGSASGGPTGSPPPVAAGGEKAKTGNGKAAEKANNASQQSDQANQAAGANPPSAGGAASGAAPTGTSAASGTSGVAGLDAVPLDFTFNGSYFDLADFFHRMKRFVRVANDDIRVQGRLMTIDNLDFASTSFPTISATVKATVYLTPKSEGTTAGGTPAGPQGSTATPANATPPPGAGGAPSPASSSPSGAEPQ